MTIRLAFERFLHWQLPLLRRQSDAQQLLVEFLKLYREMDKLVDFYNEIGQYVKAEDTCDHEANFAYQVF